MYFLHHLDKWRLSFLQSLNHFFNFKFVIKNWFSCENPTIVYNKYLRNYIQVPCGHCFACKNRRNNRWVLPLTIERTAWKYCFFVTLTYDNRFLPTVNILHYPFKKNDRKKFFDLVQDSKEYLEFCQYNLPVCSSRDLQLFIKKMRERIFRKIGERQVFRYFFSTDYGSTTFRPHWHGLIFTSNEYVARNISSLVCESWGIYDKKRSRFHSYGYCDIQHAIAGAKYVATYVNSISKLPPIYQFSDFRPRHFHSSSPSIGSFAKVRETIEEIAHRGLTEITIYNPLTCKWQRQSLYKSDLYRLFPTYPTFGSMQHFERLEIHRILSNSSKLLPSSRRKYLRYVMKVNSFFHDYITLQFKFNLDQINRKLDVLFYTFKRIEFIRNIYGLSFNDYDLLLDTYFRKRYFLSLKKQFIYEDNFLKSNPNSLDQLFSNIDLALPNGNFRKVCNYPFAPSFSLTNDDISYFSEQNLKFCRNIKSKVKNNYLELHPEFKQFH